MMPTRGELLYAQIIDRAAIDALIGEPEDGNLDCKEWPAKEKEGHEMLAKAVCGLTNSDGGVLVIGMRAKPTSTGDPDVITEARPVPDSSQVRSRILTLVGMLVEPPIVGIETREISEAPGAKAGFVVIHVPKSEGPPHRSRKDSRFYIRVGSVTLPMEYWQIEDRFGSRPHAKVELVLEKRGAEQSPVTRKPLRRFALGLKNSGSGVARFPALWFKRKPGLFLDQYGIDGNRNFGIPLRPSEGEWIVFGGGVDDVIYPGQELMIALLTQDGVERGNEGSRSATIPSVTMRSMVTRYVFSKVAFECSISSDGGGTTTVEWIVDEEEYIP